MAAGRGELDHEYASVVSLCWLYVIQPVNGVSRGESVVCSRGECPVVLSAYPLRPTLIYRLIVECLESYSFLRIPPQPNVTNEGLLCLPNLLQGIVCCLGVEP
jgi:hypothetical protein